MESLPDNENRLAIVDTPTRRWGANLPVTIVEEWERFEKRYSSSRPHLISIALHAFMQVSDDKKSAMMAAYNRFKRKAATDRGFREAMAGLGFTDAE